MPTRTFAKNKKTGKKTKTITKTIVTRTPAKNWGLGRKKGNRNAFSMDRKIWPMSRLVMIGTGDKSFGVGTRVDGSAGFTFNGAPMTAGNMQLYFSLNGITVNASGNNSVTSANLPNATELTGLFDQYAIDYLEIRIGFSANMNSTTNKFHGLPEFIIAKDYDDASQTTLNDLLQYDNAEVWQPNASNTSFMVRMKPRAANMFYNGLTTGYAPSNPGQFFDVAYPDMPFYGLKLAWQTYSIKDTSAETLMGYLNFTVKYHFRMKGMR